jgi:phosphate transport system permease protein
MTTAVIGEVRLRRDALTRVHFTALVLVAVGVGALLGFGLRSGGVVGFVLWTVLTYLVAQSVISFAIEGARRARDRLATGLITITFALAVLPLVSVLYLTVSKGLAKLSPAFLTHSMQGVAESDPNGGIYHAILGTIEQVALASLLAVPLSLLVAIFLVEYGKNSRTARAVSFFVDIMMGLPSIVTGLFVLALWVLGLGLGYSGFAGALALSMLMVPVTVRSTEEMLKLVPDSLREASYALGVPKWRTILGVVLPTALAGIVTGVMLAISRVMGETAPLLLTVLGVQFINTNPFSSPQESLPLFVFNEAQQPYDSAIARAWAGALTLIVIVMLLNLAGRIVARIKGVRVR